MAIPITGLPNFPTKNQIPDHSIMDYYNKQAYLGNQYIAGPDTFTLDDTAEHPILYISNPATSMVSLFVSDMNLNAGGSSDVILFRIYSNGTSLSGGTTKTAINCRILSSHTSVAVVKSGPTVGGAGVLSQTIAVGFNAQSIKNPIFILDPGSNLVVTGQASAAATAICQMVWYEI